MLLYDQLDCEERVSDLISDSGSQAKVHIKSKQFEDPPPPSRHLLIQPSISSVASQCPSEAVAIIYKKRIKGLKEMRTLKRFSGFERQLTNRFTI